MRKVYMEVYLSFLFDIAVVLVSFVCPITLFLCSVDLRTNRFDAIPSSLANTFTEISVCNGRK